MSILAKKYPWSKWGKHLALWKDPELHPNVPHTELLDSGSLHLFLYKYPVVFVKPCCGGGGRGVIKLMRNGPRVRVKTLSDRYDIRLEQAYPLIKRQIGKQSYIVQQGIELLGIEGRPIDFRALLLKPEDEWLFMGIMGKLAVPNQIVTNHCRGGQSITFKEAILRSTDILEEEIIGMQIRMEELSQRIAKALHQKYNLITELGLDIGIDVNGSYWLIEANTRPQYKLFLDHDDKELYPRIDGIIRHLRRGTA